MKLFINRLNQSYSNFFRYVTATFVEKINSRINALFFCKCSVVYFICILPIFKKSLSTVLCAINKVLHTCRFVHIYNDTVYKKGLPILFGKPFC